MVAFLAALGPALGALKAGGSAALAGGSKLLSSPGVQKGLLGALGGGLTQEFGGDQAFNAFLQQMLANQQNQQVGSNELPGTIIN